jgi:hypothetical protein
LSHTKYMGRMEAAGTPKSVTFIADRIISTPGLSRDGLKDELAHTQLNIWANDSFEDAKAFAYLDGYLPGAPAPPRGDPLPDVEPVPSGFEKNARDVAQKRNALAGYRLADQLNRSLAGQ